MPPEDLTKWFVLTLSAEQAARDQDFDHLDVLLNRREEILAEWDKEVLRFTAKQQEEIERAEHRLTIAMLELKNALGAEASGHRLRSAAVAAYKAS